MSILLIGKRAKILNDVAGRLRSLGHQVILTNDLDMAHLTSIDVTPINAVVFGRALTAEQKTALTKLYRQANPSLSFIEGWAPIPELITSQILSSTDPILGIESKGTVVTAHADVDVNVKRYKINWLYQVKSSESTVRLKAGVPTDIADAARGFQYFALEDKGRYITLKRDA